jgi:S-adenosylhomocysteine hydrolase
MPFSRP